MFCGYEQREEIGFATFVSSVLHHASQPVNICAITSLSMPEGSNAFTFSRFLVPHLMKYSGMAIYLDASDMLMLDDVVKLGALYDHTKAVQVVKHPTYKTQHPIKYIGTDMRSHNRDYTRKNWASVMLINCSHYAWREMTPERVEMEAPSVLLGLKFIQPDDIGDLPNKWNRLVDEGQSVEGAALLHFTTGIPAFAHYANTPGADTWREYRDRMLEVDQSKEATDA